MKKNIKTFPIKKHYLINSLDEKETNIVTNGKAIWRQENVNMFNLYWNIEIMLKKLYEIKNIFGKHVSSKN